ncbi:DUF2189 domain-containing protein [Ectothiorhodospira marina]|uniref:Uncharacterized membrane protein n=1 Tax=Ectothiorhodospira marina TaxID=1396821 RepID=A0A1H7KU55_9GAMM|nr:DUF2189 domain-containing protein [Ectothiorhodospira marina]SEK90329.1 Uncharacterized membrane protein [Ectothiorhodospira marina]
MDRSINTGEDTPPAQPALPEVPPDRPIQWLTQGMRDFLKAPLPGLIYGLIASGAGYLILWGVRAEPFLILSFVAGFLLVGPLSALGIYESSRLLEQGQSVGFIATWRVWRENPVTIGLYIAFLSVVMIAWIRFTSLMLALLFDRLPAGLQTGWSPLFTSLEGLMFLGVFVVSGAAAAFLVFVTGVVTLCVVTDRRGDLIEGITTSVGVVRRNPATMAVWATLLVGLTAVGLSTLMLGLVVILPILGHATWRAYRDLVQWPA